MIGLIKHKIHRAGICIRKIKKFVRNSNSNRASQIKIIEDKVV